MDDVMTAPVATAGILEAQYAAIVRSAMDAIITVDESGRILVFNPAAEEMFRCSAAEVLGRPLDRFIPARYSEPRPTPLQALNRLSAEPAKIRRFRTLRSDGEEFSAEMTLSQIHVGGRKLVTAIVRDVTERDAAGLEHERAVAAFRSAGEGIVMTDAAGVIEYVNPAFERIYGYSTGEVIGRQRRDLQGAPYLADFYEEIRRAVAERGAWQGRYVGARKDGTPVELECTVAAVRAADGTIVGFVGLENDVTAYKQAERTLERQQQLLNAILDSSTAVIYVKDWGGRYLLANRSYEKLRNIHRSDIVGKTDYDLFPRETANALRENDRAVLASGMPLEWEEQIPTEDGVRTFLSNKFPLFDGEKAPYAVCGMSTDITERKRIQEELSQTADQLQRLSHQLMQAQELERNRISRELHDEVGQALTAVKVNLMAIRLQPPCEAFAERLEDCIDVVDLALAGVRDLSLDLRPTLLEDMGLPGALRWYARRQAERTGLQIDLLLEQVPEALPSLVRTQCYRIAQEALTNVLRHSGAQHVEIRLEGHSHGLNLVIADNGHGADRDAILHRAARGESLGLVNMRERAELAGGWLEINSEPGKGMCVEAFFPLEQAGADRPQGAN